MPDWVKDMSIAGIIVVGIVVVALKWIEAKKEEKPRICAELMTPYLLDSTKTNTELLRLLKTQQDEFRRYNEKQQEAMQNMVIALNSVINLAKETLERVKELKR